MGQLWRNSHIAIHYTKYEIGGHVGSVIWIDDNTDESGLEYNQITKLVFQEARNLKVSILNKLYVAMTRSCGDLYIIKKLNI